MKVTKIVKLFNMFLFYLIFLNNRIIVHVETNKLVEFSS